MKDMFVCTYGYKIYEDKWVPFGCVVAKGIYEMWSIKRDAIR